MSEPACPWDGMAEVTDPHLFCEEHLCGWIEQPANAWSSLAYAVFGVAVLVASRKRGGPANLGWCGIALGAGSFFMHASMTFLGQIADLGAMFLLAAWVAARNVGAWRGWPRASERMLFWGLVAASLAILIVFRRGSGAFLALIALALGFEVMLRKSRAGRANYRPLFAALGLTAVSFGAWLLDVTRVWCDPADHLWQGHAAWHVLNAPVFWLVYLFHRSLDENR